MSISDINLPNESIVSLKKKSRIFYIASAVFFFIFQLVYEHFSHSVISYYMVLAFLIPVAGLALNELEFCLYGLKNEHSESSFNSFYYAAQFLTGSVIWLTLGSIYEGVLQIYGTTNHLIFIFAVLGIVQLAASVFFLILSKIR